MAFNTHETVRLLVNNEVLVKNWKVFASELNLTISDIVHCENSFNNTTITPYDLFYKLLFSWRSINGSSGTLDTLVKIINKVGAPTKYQVSKNCLVVLGNPDLVFYGVTPTVNNFTGRDQEISVLKQTFNSAVKYVLVCGLGGIGKTELVKKFACNMSQNNHVTWFNGDTQTSLSSSIADLATHLGIQTSVKDKKDQLEILYKISTLLSNRKWLMIIDNVDESHEKYESVIKFTVIVKNICVVVTSQSRLVLYAPAELIEIDNLLPEDAFKLVQTSLESENSAEDIENLCTTLQYFPLALQQAIAYIIQQQRQSTLGTKYRIQEYLKEFESQKMKLFEYKPGLTNEYRKTILLTWNLTLQKLRRQHEQDFCHSISVLNNLAFLGPDNINCDFLFQVCLSVFKLDAQGFFEKIKLLRLSHGLQQKKHSFSLALSTLKSYSIIKVESNVISVHPLVQELIRFNLDEKAKTQILDTVIRNLDIESLHRQEIQHILRVWSHIQKQTELFIKHKTVTIKIYDRLVVISQYYESLRFAENNFQLFKEKLGEDDLYTLLMERCIATATRDTGKYEEALVYFQIILPKMQRILGKEDSATLKTANDMAVTLTYLQRHSEAVEMHYEILQVEINKYGKDNKDIINTKHNIALALDPQGKHKEAMELYQEVLEWQKNKLGPHHPLTLFTRHNIAVCLFRQSKHEEALIEFENILELRVKYLGEEHAHTLNTKSWLADTLRKLGQEERALKMQNEILPLQISILGEDHPSTLITRHNMAVCLFRQSKHEEALIEFENILELRVKYLGEEHAHTLNTKSWLADTLRKLGQEERALKMQNEILPLQISILGEDHPSTLITRHNMAVCLFRQSKYEEALIEFENILELRVKYLGEEHAHTLNTKSWLADTMRKLGQEERALKMQNEILPLQISILGEDHPETIATKSRIELLNKSFDLNPNKFKM